MKCSEDGCIFNADGKDPEPGKCPRHKTKGLKKQKKSTPIRKVAIKRQEELDEYYKETRPAQLKAFPDCQICQIILQFKAEGGEADWWPRCGKKGTEVHHVEARNGARVNTSKKMTSCDSKKNRNGHQWIKEHPKQSEHLGLTISRTKTPVQK